MNRINPNNPVVVYNDKGKPIAHYASVLAVAEAYHTTEDTIRLYINNGKLWKKNKVFLDLDIEVG